jgi:autotransporter-associated beta strand protein
MYAVQVWVNDNRNSPTNLYDRQVRVTGGGGNSVDLDFNVQNAAGGVGQFTIGRFTADSTTQTFTMLGLNTSTGPSSQVNAIQLRDISAYAGVWSGAASSAWNNTALNWGYGEAFSEIPAGDLNASGTAANPSVVVSATGISLGGGTLNFTSSSLNYVLSAAGTLGVSGSAGLSKSGSGRLTISSPNSMTGPTVLSAGSILAGTVNALPSGALTISAGAALDISGFNQTLGALTNNGLLTNTGSLATLRMASYESSSTVLSGPLALEFTSATSYSGSLGANIASLSNLSATITLEATAATVQVGSLGKTFASNAGLKVLGPVSGTGDLVVQANGSGLVFVDGNLNFNGTVTNNGIGTTGTHAGTGTSSTITLGTMTGKATKGTVILSGEIGTGVTKVIQDSPTSALCLYANNTAWSGTLEIRQGAALVTIYDTFATGNVTPNGAGKGTIVVGTGAADAAFLYHADFSPQPPRGWARIPRIPLSPIHF